MLQSSQLFSDEPTIKSQIGVALSPQSTNRHTMEYVMNLNSDQLFTPSDDISNDNSLVSGKTKRKMKRQDFPCRNFYTGHVIKAGVHDGTVYCEQLKTTLAYSTCTGTKTTLNETEDMANDEDFTQYVQRGTFVLFNIYPSTKTIRRMLRCSDVYICVSRIVKFAGRHCITSCVIHGEAYVDVATLNTRTAHGQNVVTTLVVNDALCLAIVPKSKLPLAVYGAYVTSDRVETLRQCFIMQPATECQFVQ
jgi:hypothetical protein